MILTGLGLLCSYLLPTYSQAPTDFEKSLITLAHEAIRAEVSRTSFTCRGHSPVKAVFVTIECLGKIRGCRGDLLPRTRSLEDEVVQAAKSAACHDPRYRPLSVSELRNCLVTVTLIDRLEPLDDIGKLSPAEGLVLTSEGKTGVVLPWEGRDPNTRLNWAHRKAGVSVGSAATLDLLIAERFRG